MQLTSVMPPPLSMPAEPMDGAPTTELDRKTQFVQTTVLPPPAMQSHRRSPGG